MIITNLYVKNKDGQATQIGIDGLLIKATRGYEVGKWEDGDDWEDLGGGVGVECEKNTLYVVHL